MGMLFEAVIYLAAAIITVPISKRLGFGSVLGYLVAGILIGPYGVGLIGNADHTLHFAELGVVFLLFVIGLELQPSRLWVLRKMVFGLGSAQFFVSAAAITAAAWICGLALQPAAVIGAILALSSTAFVLQLLAEKKQLTTSYGRAAFAILLFQDLAVIPLIALLPLVGDSSGDALGLSNLAIMVAAILGLVIGGRYLLRPVLQLVARTGIPELFTAITLLVVVGAAMVMQAANMSMALGAFIAGMLLADSEFRHELEADIAPFKGLLLGLFFIAVGMTVNLQLLAQQPLLICGLVVLLMGTKALVLYPIARLFGMCDKKAGLRLAVVLSQGGEFAFVLFGLVARQNILEPTLIDKLILVVAVSMMLTPIIYTLVEKFSNRYDDNAEPEFDDMEDEHPAVIIAGFGRFGQIVARLLRIADRPFTALELDSSQVDVVRKYGTKVFYGDASKLDILRAAGAAEAKIFVLAIDDIESSVRTAETVSRHFPNLQIVARARNRRHEYKLMDLGIEHIYRETFLSSIALGENVLTELGISPPEVQTIAELFIDRDRKLMIEQHAVQHDEERLIQSAKETAAELDTLLQRDLQD